MHNTVILVGRLTKEPELRYTAESVGVATFTLAVQRDYKNSDGNYDSDFINCVTYRNTAEFVNNYIHKGDLVIAHGRITTGSYETDKGERRYTTTVTVEKIKGLMQKKQDVETKQIDEEKDFDPNTIETIDDDSLPF